MGRTTITVFLVLIAASLVRPAAAQEFDTWQSTCAENRLAGTVCTAELTTRLMRFVLTVGARGDGDTAQISLRLSEGTLRYAQMRIDQDQTTYDFICLADDCVMDAESAQAAMQIFGSAKSAAVRLTTGRGTRIMMRFDLDGFADALAQARAGT